MDSTLYIAEIIGPIPFNGGVVTGGNCLISLACNYVNVWLYPSNGLVTIPVNVAKKVLKTLRDSQNKPIKWVKGA